MIGSLYGPWFACVAIVLLAAAVRRGPRPDRAELLLVVALFVGATALRLLGGVWGPLHVNGQGPLWIRGALDPAVLGGYGPGYFELFSWVRRAGVAPDRAIFTANVLLSALCPALLYGVARLVGVARGGALAAAVVLATDAVIVRTAASEAYFSALAVLVMGVQFSLAIAGWAQVRGDRVARPLALVAAGLFAAAAARIHPMAYALLALCPLVVLCAAQPVELRSRLKLTVAGAAVIGAIVLLSSATTLSAALRASPMTGQVLSALSLGDYELLLAVAAAGPFVGRWLTGSWLSVISVASLAVMLATQGSFQQHPLWTGCYQRLFLPGLLLGAAPFLAPRQRSPAWGLVSGTLVAAMLFMAAPPSLRSATTEQLEYRFLQTVLRDVPPGCTLAAVSRAGKRMWEIPSYLIPSGGPGAQRAIESPSDLLALGAADCVLYVHSSLCTSVEARPLCEAVQRAASLERVASRVLPAVPSYVGLAYDRPEVEVVVFRTGDSAKASERPPAVDDGAAITPEFAQALYDRLAPLREADGCRLIRFDTSRFRISAGLLTRFGGEHRFELSTAADADVGRRAGAWAIAASVELQSDCAMTLAAIERVLLDTAAPQGWWRGGGESTAERGFLPSNHAVLAGVFVLLVLGTVHILFRELRARRPSPYAVLALVLVCGAALAVRLTLSPRTFLHEYYHIAETVPGYLTGEIPPAYGKTGPAMFRLVGSALGRTEDVQIIFLTTALVSSLAVPALALLDLAVMASWPRALCAAVLLAVLPQHLRFSAAEDLFVHAVTFGMWTLALFALYLRTRRLEDALVGALALSLAMQARPEMLFFPAVLVMMVLLVEPRSWRVLVAWRTLAALTVLAVLLVPRFFEFRQALAEGPGPTAMLPAWPSYRDNLVLLQSEVTPPLYWVLCAIGLAWDGWRRPGYHLWAILVFVGYTLFSLSIFSNPPYNLRSQILPTAFLVLIAAGAASAWMAAWGYRRRQALGIGACVLAALAVAVLVRSRGFVTELRDQQLEWMFLERTVPRLPERATLLSAVDTGGHNLDAFPEFLLSGARKTYRMVDVRRAARGEVEWPTPGEDLLYYQGMFCYFAFDDEPSPDPMTPTCQAVHQRYVAEPLFVEDLHTRGYSAMRYAGGGQGPFRIGFYRLTGAR